ncbi:MAG: hypothetical protein ACRC1M_02635 [Methanobacteriaceae archaeon]
MTKIYTEEFEYFEPLHLLNLAKNLYNDLNDDNIMNNIQSHIPKSTIIRTIVNRIYYAIFLYIRSWLIEKYDYKSSYGDHGLIPKFFKEEKPLNPYVINKNITSRFYLLKNNRQYCDYELNVHNKEKICGKWFDTELEDLFKDAEYIISMLK